MKSKYVAVALCVYYDQVTTVAGSRNAEAIGLIFDHFLKRYVSSKAPEILFQRIIFSGLHITLKKKFHGVK